jgi:phosphoheptose isomerase
LPSSTNAIRRAFADSIAAKRAFVREHAATLARVGDLLAERFAAGSKVLLFGNGGSAADAQHIAAELVGRFLGERKAMAAIALTTDTSALTAIANDYGYDEVFARQVRALGRAGDVAIGISTSGKSPSVLRAVEAARVHLAMPKPSVFVREQQKPSASVILNLRGGRTLDPAQVSAIVHLVSSSVPDLPVTRVTVLDQQGTLLSAQSEAEEAAPMASDMSDVPPATGAESN